MGSIKRSVADFAGRLIGAHMVPPHRIGRFYEQEQIRRIIAGLDIDCVFDVGANAGQYARMLREELGYSGGIVSFEPVPALARHLQTLAASVPNWHVCALALDRQAGPTRFKVMNDTQFSSLHSPSAFGQEMFANGLTVSEEIEVEARTLESEFYRWRDKLKFERPYLKLDTQGHDLAIGESAGGAIREFVAIQSETAIHKIYNGIPDLAESIGHFRKAGFELCAFVPNNEGVFPLLVETDCIYINVAWLDAVGPRSSAAVHSAAAS
jgi:FkbM family methyltransferase